VIRAEASIDVSRTEAEVFAVLDDFDRMPRWLAMCAKLEQTSPPPRRVGSTLRYAYKEGGRVKLIDGSVTAYEPGRRLAMAFADTAFKIAVSFEIATTGAATRLTHTVEIEPLSLPMKLLTPVIRAATQRQLAKDTETLKTLLSARA
jgi:carbon monoxide dehydrogenase subunit G